MIMKAKRFFMGMMLALCLAAPAVASGLGDIRVNARFLTDRMAFELSLTQTQYNDLYEVNYDFFSGIDPYVAAMARQEAYALEICAGCFPVPSMCASWRWSIFSVRFMS